MDRVVFVFSYTPSPNTDMRTFSVYELHEPEISGRSRTEHYKFLHPVTGLNIGMTNFYRHNLKTGYFEPAGCIEWLSNYNATIQFGIDEVPIQELRKVKRNRSVYAFKNPRCLLGLADIPESRSRQFKADGIWYKWKMGENGVDLFCYNSRGHIIASWIHSEQQLIVSVRALDILDRLVVTCMLNLWMRYHGEW